MKVIEILKSQALISNENLVDDQSEEEIESRINDLSLLNGHPLNSGNFENVS